MKFGKIFKECRLMNGLTQLEVAQKLNIRQSNISDWENDVSEPDLNKLIKLSEIYGVTVSELLGLDQ